MITKTKSTGRDYQVAALDSTYRLFAGGRKHVRVRLPTGTGKTVLAAMVVERMKASGGRALFLAERTPLIRQAYSQLKGFGLKCAIESGQQKAQEAAKAFGKADVVIATVQTLRGTRLKSWPRDEFALVITDECHHAPSKSYRAVYDHFVMYKHLGITATPKKGVFEEDAYVMTLTEAISKKWLVPIIPMAIPIEVDLTKIRRDKGDLNLGDMSERIGPKIEIICRAIKQEIGDRHGVVFTPDVASATGFAQVLRDIGVTAKWVSGVGGTFKMKKPEQQQILREFEKLDFQVIVCANLLTEGWDCTHVEFVAVARATNSVNRYTQMVGRGTRPCEGIGKKDCLILDFDWKCDDSSRDLASAVDLYDDGDEPIPEPVKERMRKIIKDGDKTLDEILEQAKLSLHSRPRLDIKLTGQTVDYRKYIRDPTGIIAILGLKANKHDRVSNNAPPPWVQQKFKLPPPASQGQKYLLQKFGMESPQNISSWGASRLIDKLKKRHECGLATPLQVQQLLIMGYNDLHARNMRTELAAQEIKNNWKPEMMRR